MAKKDDKGNWTFEPEEEAQIEMGARMRVRASELLEESKKKREEEDSAKLCPDCKQPKHEGKCKKAKPDFKMY